MNPILEALVNLATNIGIIIGVLAVVMIFVGIGLLLSKLHDRNGW